MADADFWREQSRGFKSLSRELEYIRIDWKRMQDGSLSWKILTPSAAPQFKALAIRSGKEINPTSKNYFNAWIEGVSQYCFKRRHNIFPGTELDENGIEVRVVKGVVVSACWTSADYCSELEVEALERPGSSVEVVNALPTNLQLEPTAQRDVYMGKFQEKILILDICWAANQRYREWKKWIKGKVKVGTKPDRAFRAILASGLRPSEYRTDVRPVNWM